MESRRQNKRQRENSVATVEPLDSFLVSPAIVKKKIRAESGRTPEGAVTPETPGSGQVGLEFSMDLGDASWADIVESEEREKKATQRRSTPTKKEPKCKVSLLDYNFSGAKVKEELTAKSTAEARRSPRKRKGDEFNTATTPTKTAKSANGGVWDIRSRAATDCTLSPLPIHRRPTVAVDEDSNSNFTRRISARIHSKAEPSRADNSGADKWVPIDFSSLATSNTATTGGGDVVPAAVKDLREKLSRNSRGSAANSSFGMTTRSHDTTSDSHRRNSSRSSSCTTDGADIPPWELPIPDKKYTEPTNGWEKDPNTLAKRQKDIDKGKNSAIYKRLIAEVPKKERIKGVHPKTPNKYIKTPRRSWDMQVRLWRKLLYCYDDPSKALRDVSFTSASDAGDSSYVGSSRSHSSAGDTEDNLSSVSDELNLSGVEEIIREEVEDGRTLGEVIQAEETVTLPGTYAQAVMKSAQTDFSALLTQ